MCDTLWVGHHLHMSVYSTVCGWEEGEGWRQSGPAAPGTLGDVVF